MAEETKSSGPAALQTPRVLDHGRRQFLIASRRGRQALGAGIRPVSSGAVRGLVGQIPGLEIVRVLRPRTAVSALALSADEATEVYVARIDPDRAELIRQTLPAQLLMEEDALLDYAPPIAQQRPLPTRLAAWNTTGGLETRQIRLRVVGEGERPLVNVGVSLDGEGVPQEGRTDKRGEVVLPLVALPGARARALVVTAPGNYWDHYLVQPELSEADINVVRLRALSETITGFPEQVRYGWGQIQMGLHRIPETLTGKGVKIALIDSGVDTSHPLLRHIRLGVDYTNSGTPQSSWAQDVLGHGSHRAGIIAARDDSGRMLRGFTPEAEIHIIKVVPGGRLSSVIEALDYCLEREVDIVNLGVRTPWPSPALEQKLEDAAMQGLACIVGAGDSGGPVEYPASSPHAFAVAAVGRLNEYPDTTWDATTVWPAMVAADGIFLPSFSCHGPQVAVCAPGVAVASTVPGGFQPQSGTAVAAPHVTGLAALLLGHHAVFQGPLRERNQQRVVGLFNMIRLMCVPYAFGAPLAGAGLPRLHGLEQVLRENKEAASPGNGQAAVARPVILGSPIGQLAGPLGTPTLAPTFFSPLVAMAPTGAVIGQALIDPFSMSPPLAAQPWSLQALLEPMRWPH